MTVTFGPTLPGSPRSPGVPAAPLCPLKPNGPCGPGIPGPPVGPFLPVTPFAPVSPGNPYKGTVAIFFVLLRTHFFLAIRTCRNAQKMNFSIKDFSSKRHIYWRDP